MKCMTWEILTLLAFSITTILSLYFIMLHYGDDRSSSVQLICDESEVKGRFEYVGMPVVRTFQFKLYTQCACPGKCTSS